ncbi:MAG: hypothetical protein AAF483_19960 [Planctomycetota bacterium]
MLSTDLDHWAWENSYERQLGDARSIRRDYDPKAVFVTWEPIELDLLNGVAMLKGKLRQRSKTPEAGTPKANKLSLDQGISVVIDYQEVNGEDAIEAMDLKKNPLLLTKGQSYCWRGLTERGDFEAKFLLGKQLLQAERPYKVRIGLAMATHRRPHNSSVPDTFPETVTWTSRDKLLDGSVHIGTIPAGYCLDAVMQQMHDACKQKYQAETLLKAVNTLQTLGKSEVLAKVDKYHELYNRTRELEEIPPGLFYMLKLLFEPLESGKRIQVNYLSRVPREAKYLCPLDPLLVINDFPFLYPAPQETSVGSHRKQWNHLIQEIREEYVLRDAPYVPKGEPSEFIPQLQYSQVMQCLEEQERERVLRDFDRQALRMRTLSTKLSNAE